MKKYYLSKCKNIAVIVIDEMEIRTFTLTNSNNVKRAISSARIFNTDLYNHLEGEYSKIDYLIFEEFFDQFFAFQCAMLNESKLVLS